MDEDLAQETIQILTGPYPGDSVIRGTERDDFGSAWPVSSGLRGVVVHTPRDMVEFFYMVRWEPDGRVCLYRRSWYGRDVLPELPR